MRQSDSGISLIELLLVLAILTILMGALLRSMDESQTIAAISRDENEMRQNLQDALFLLSSEIKMSGFPPQNFYDREYLQSPSSFKNLVASGLLQAAPQDIRFQGDINNDGEVEYVHYYLSGTVPPFTLNRFGGKLNRIDGSLPSGSPQKLSEFVQHFQLKYYNKNGAETSALQEVLLVEVHLTMRTRRVDPLTRVYRTASQLVRVRPMNL
jgi:type II secretory pathway component PulJ